MTTQELKQYIDKVLGNNLRCLLPSYWWKRLFSLTLDKVDEKLDAANIKTINGESVIGEGNLKVGITSVGSMEELNALEAEIGDVATVGVDGEYTKINTDECIILGFDKIAERWDELTPVDKVDALGYSGDGAFGIYLATKNGNDDMVQAVYFNNSYSYQQYNNDTLRAISKSKLDELLAENDYRYIAKFAQEDVSTVFALYTKSPSSANAYIKGDTWTRLLKEGEGGSNITIDSELSATSENPVQNKVIYENLYGMNQQYIQMYEEQNRVFTNAINNVNTELLKKVDQSYVDNAIANAITTTLNTAV